MAKQHIEEKQQDINELMQVRRDKMQAFIDKGIEPFGRSYDVTHHAQELLDQFETLGEETVVRVAGRLMAKLASLLFPTLAEKFRHISVLITLAKKNMVNLNY